MSRHDGIKWWPTATVEKFNASTVRDIAAHLGVSPTDVGHRELQHMKLHESLTPDSVLEVEGNLLMDAGKTRVAALIIGTGAINPFNSTYGVIGVGNSSANPTTTSYTSLQGGASSFYKPRETGPSNTDGVISSGVTFATDQANFAWNEWCWVIASQSPVANASITTAAGAGAVMLNRKVASLGTKANGSAWTLSTTVSITNPA